DADQEMLIVEPELHERQERATAIGAVHRAGGLADLEAAGAKPFEVAGLSAVERRRQQRDWLRLCFGGGRAADVADEELVGRWLLHQLVRVPDVPPEQVVELEIVRRRMVVPVPPEPVAAFGDENLFPGSCQGRGISGR